MVRLFEKLLQNGIAMNCVGDDYNDVMVVQFYSKNHNVKSTTIIGMYDFDQHQNIDSHLNAALDKFIKKVNEFVKALSNEESETEL